MCSVRERRRLHPGDTQLLPGNLWRADKPSLVTVSMETRIIHADTTLKVWLKLNLTQLGLKMLLPCRIQDGLNRLTSCSVLAINKEIRFSCMQHFCRAYELHATEVWRMHRGQRVNQTSLCEVTCCRKVFLRRSVTCPTGRSGILTSADGLRRLLGARLFLCIEPAGELLRARRWVSPVGLLTGLTGGWVEILSAAQPLMKDAHCCQPWGEN